MLTAVAIWKGVESLRRPYNFFVTSFPYIDPDEEITSSSGSFRSCSSNNNMSNMSASREGRDAGLSTDGGGYDKATPFPFPFAPVGTPREGAQTTLDNSYPFLRLGGRTVLLGWCSGNLSCLGGSNGLP